MPVYEYLAEDCEGCEHCRTRFQWLQSISEDPLTQCPKCGGPVARIVSKSSFKVGQNVSPEKAAKHGFTTFKKAGKGTWEKLAGPGVDVIQGSESEIQAAKADPKPSKVIDLDAP